MQRVLLVDTPGELIDGLDPAPPPCVCVSSKPVLCFCLLVSMALFLIIPPAIRGEIPDITAAALKHPQVS